MALDLGTAQSPPRGPGGGGARQSASLQEAPQVPLFEKFITKAMRMQTSQQKRERCWTEEQSQVASTVHQNREEVYAALQIRSKHSLSGGGVARL